MLTAMFRGNKIIALNAHNSSNLEDLRKRWNSEARCSICDERILCRFGEKRVYHFAHREGSACPGDSDTQEHMKGKYVLYEKLQESIKEKKSIELEFKFDDADFHSDLLIEMKNGKRVVIEYFSGHIRKKDIERRKELYADKGIPVIWLISNTLFQDFPECPGAFKISNAIKNMLVITGIEKYYFGDWEKEVLEMNRSIPMPDDSISKGSLHFFDHETMQLFIYRGVCSAHHYQVYTYRAEKTSSILNASFTKKLDGFYFKEEKELGPKFSEAKKLCHEIQQKEERKRKKHQEKLDREWEEYKQKQDFCTLTEDSNTLDESAREAFYRSDSSEYTCEICGAIYKEDEMVSFIRTKRTGKCKICIY